MNPHEIEDVRPDEEFSKITSLEEVVGFKVAENTYDLLTIREQIIVDLLCAGWNQGEIGKVFGQSQPAIAASIRRVRFKLADSELRLVLGLRENFRTVVKPVEGNRMDKGEWEDGHDK